MSRFLVALFCLALAGCGEEEKRFGWGFLLYCPDAQASWVSDKTGRVKSVQPSILTMVFVPYGGGMFDENGKHLPMDFGLIMSGCHVIKGLPTYSDKHGFHVNGIEL